MQQGNDMYAGAGNVLADKICPECGTKNPGTEAECYECGAELPDADAQDEQEAPAEE